MVAGDSKGALRGELISARLRMSLTDRAHSSDAIARRLLGLDAYLKSRTVALYAPLGGEVDTGAIARSATAQGKRLAFPLLVPGERAMRFAFCPATSLVPGTSRALEPPPDAPIAPLSDLDLLLIPGVAFDPQGWRLGRGRGHYDATLAALPAAALRVGLAFELQIVPSVPREAHDAQLDAVVTEARVILAPPRVAELSPI
ncbi:MAG TPA: 5-formyltetrahydrofolate cyclo-ligase [Anaeromyxobacteraceae bacterium]|nr:5-formyltetrahydrofolate cyclo-ligase [Anaeromyxobacteraceae bacterium]